MPERPTDERAELPEDVVDEAERLTRLARAAVDEAEATAYREERDDLVAAYGYATRVREDDDGDVLVCYPDEWVEDGLIRPDRIEDVDRGVERVLSGTADPDDWERVADHNDEIVARVADDCGEDDHGNAHVANARALADFASNHYAKPIGDLTRAELQEFLDEYFPRNAWPTERQRALVEDSIDVTFEKTDARCPLD